MTMRLASDPMQASSKVGSFEFDDPPSSPANCYRSTDQDLRERKTRGRSWLASWKDLIHAVVQVACCDEPRWWETFVVDYDHERDE